MIHRTWQNLARLGAVLAFGILAAAALTPALVSQPDPFSGLSLRIDSEFNPSVNELVSDGSLIRLVGTTPATVEQGYARLNLSTIGATMFRVSSILAVYSEGGEANYPGFDVSAAEGASRNLRCFRTSNGTFTTTILISFSLPSPRVISFVLECTSVAEGTTLTPTASPTTTFTPSPSHTPTYTPTQTPITEPDMAVSVNGTQLANHATLRLAGPPVASVEVGSVPMVVSNTGNSLLSVSSAVISTGGNYSAFDVAPFESLTLSLRCFDTAETIVTRVITFASNDPDENPYEITVVCETTLHPTATATPTATSTPTITPTPTETLTPTPTATGSQTASPTATADANPTLTAESTAEASSTALPSLTPAAPVQTGSAGAVSGAGEVGPLPSATLLPPLNEAAGMPGGPVFASVPLGLEGIIAARMLIVDGASGDGYTLGSAIAAIGIPIDADRLVMAVDLFSTETARQTFADPLLLCLRGSGQLVFLAHSGSPRTAVEVSAISPERVTGYTCTLLTEPGTLVLLHP